MFSPINLITHRKRRRQIVIPEKYAKVFKQKVITKANNYHRLKGDTLKVQNCHELKSSTLGQEVIFEVTEAKFWISSIFYKFSFRFFAVLGLRLFDLGDLRRPRVEDFNSW